MSVETRVRLPVLKHKDAADLDTLLSMPSRPMMIPELPRISVDATESTPYRTSSYTIVVDLPDRPDELLLLHGYTGAYDRVSRRVAAYVRSLVAHRVPLPLYGDWSSESPYQTEPVLPPSDETVARLRKRGYLTQMTKQQEESYFAQIAATLHQASLRQRPSFVLMPTYQCNLRCSYCFQDHMRTQPEYQHLLGTMTQEMVDRVFLGMAQIEVAHGLPVGTPGRSITLFGGEPLLRENRPIIEYILRKAREVDTSQISAISNATDLDAYEDLLGPQGIRMVQITLDGPPDEHDLRRIYADGSGSFARIVDNISMALGRGTSVSLRINVDHHNIVRLPELAELFQRKGWTENPNFEAYAATLHIENGKAGSDATLGSKQLQQFLAEQSQQHQAVRSLKCDDHSMTAQARQLFEQRQDPLSRFKTSFCGAHDTMYVIDSFGDIYACWERTGDPSLRIGAINASGAVYMNSEHLRQWRGRNVSSNPVCRQCRYAAYCGGGCAVQAEEAHGSLSSNYCDGFAKRFRASVVAAFSEYAQGDQTTLAVNRHCGL